jgi:hypothetical protein
MRLNLILAALVAIMAYVTCKNLRNTAAAPDNVGTATTATAPASGSDAPATPAKSSVKVPALVHIPIDEAPKPNASRKAYLSGGYWNFDAAVSGSNEDMLIAEYRSKWLKFKEDQTFNILINNKIVHAGRWTWDEDNSQIYLSCPDPFVNGVWGIKAVGFRMVWTGNSAYINHGHQVRLSNAKELPAN